LRTKHIFALKYAPELKFQPQYFNLVANLKVDSSKFSERSPGTLIPISVPRKDWAFIPSPLPPDWEVKIELWPLLAEAKQELARLDGLARGLPNPELLLRPLQGREALRSSSLEGTYATPQQLLLFELQPREPISEHDPANTHLEVANYSRSLRRGMALLEELPFCLRLVRELHTTLLSGVRGRDKSPGAFRRTQNHIGSDYRFNPPPPNYLDECLDAFEKQLNLEQPKYDPLVQCFLLHYQFETIHPFLDGNGRVGRALLSLMVYKQCGLAMPWLYMSAYFERYKDEYIDNLFRVSTHADWSRWVTFCLKGTIRQALDSNRRCDQLRQLKDDFHKRLDNAGPRAHPIVERLFATPVLTIPEMATQFNVTYPTAKSDIERLIALKILKEIPEEYPKLYYCPPIFDIAYGEDDE
jgi:Fic family protein